MHTVKKLNEFAHPFGYHVYKDGREYVICLMTNEAFISTHPNLKSVNEALLKLADKKLMQQLLDLLIANNLVSEDYDYYCCYIPHKGKIQIYPHGVAKRFTAGGGCESTTNPNTVKEWLDLT